MYIHTCMYVCMYVFVYAYMYRCFDMCINMNVNIHTSILIGSSDFFKEIADLHAGNFVDLVCATISQYFFFTL